MHTRRNVWELGGDWADPVLWYARAVGVLKPKPLDDRTSWRFYAGMHGYHQGLWEFYDYKKSTEDIPAKADFNRFWLQCQHGSWYFLPWHRGYLIGFEKLIRATVKALGGPDDWALPYWNYFKSGQNTLPPAFADKDWPDGKGNNPLFVEQRWGPDPRHPGKVFIPLQAVNLDAMTTPDFTGVSTGGDTGFGGVDTGFEHEGRWHGVLESNPHDQVHGLVGGDMSFPGQPRRLPGLMSSPVTAGLDPIFWLHHANIDRLWEAWRRGSASHVDPTMSKWTSGPGSLGGKSFVVPLPDQTPWEFTPGEMSKLSALDYTYDSFTPGDAPAVVAAGRAPVRPSDGSSEAKGAVAMTSGAGRQTAKVELVGASDQPTPIAGAGAETSLRLDEGMRAKVAGNLAAGPAPGAQAEKVFLNLENVKGFSDATVLQVYLQIPGKAGEPATERPVGSVGLFGISQASEPDGGHAGQGLSYVLNITKAFAEIAGSNQPDLNKVSVRLEAVSPVQASADVQVGRISIVRQGK